MLNINIYWLLSTKTLPAFISWPIMRLLLLPGVTRNTKYHQYPDSIQQQLRDSGIYPARRSNYLTICSFLLAGGIRPMRENGKGWHVHHVYDGNFSYLNRGSTIHVVLEGQYFTEAAGLVALQPVARCSG
jgi:hypothetical protein